MIRVKTVSGIKSVSDMITNRGLRLSPLQGSPLEDLVRANEDLYDYTTTTSAATGDEQIINAASKAHDSALGAVVDKYSLGIRRLLSQARTVVKPIILELKETTEALMVTSEVATYERNIIVLKTPAVFDNQLLDSLLERYVGSRSALPTSLQLPYPGADVVRKLLTTNISRLDNDITTVVSGLTDNVIENIWFGLTNPSYGATAAVESLVKFLIARNLDSSPTPGIEMSSSDLTTFCAALQNYWGSTLANLQVSRAVKLRGDELVFSRDVKSVTVNGDVYKKFLANGGNADMVLGCNLRGSAEIIARGEEFVKTYAKELAMNTFKRNAATLALQNRCIQTAFTSFINNIDVTEEGLGAVPRDVLHRTLSTALMDRTMSSELDLYCFIRDLVEIVLYPKGGAVQILRDIDKQVASNPTLDAREASTLVIVDMLCTDLIKQVQIVKG